MPSKLIDQAIRAAIAEFSKCGFAGAATKTIAIQAKITEGSLFRLFGSKERLFETALRRCVQESFATGRLAEALQADGESLEHFEAAIKRGLRCAFDMATPDAIRLVNVALLERPELARSVYLTELNLANGVIAHMVDHFRNCGAIRSDVDPDFAAQFLLFALFRHRFLLAVRPPNARPLGSIQADPEKAVDQYVDMWIRGIANSSGISPKDKTRKTRARSK